MPTSILLAFEPIMKPQPNKLPKFSLLFIIFLLDSWVAAGSDVASDRISRLALREAFRDQYLLWNISEDRTCNWTGVTCLGNRVVELWLPGMGLSGPIPANLVMLNLANNNFTGAISPNFNKLTRLATLYLEVNQLNGSIRELNLGFLDQFNVSFNKLTGPIPEWLSSKPVNLFEGNSLCGKPLLHCNGSLNGVSNKLSGGGIAGVVIGCFIGCLCKRERIKQGGVKADEDPNQSEQVEISLEERVADINDASTGSHERSALGVAKGNTSLLRASVEVMGKGTFGTSYKASLEIGTTMVVIRLRDFNGSKKEFEEMVKAIEKINHENLLPLSAYYYSRDEKLLVYEYMPMGSLSALLHGSRGGDRSPLNWDTRIGIALGAAGAIVHLHSLDPAMSHGNIKSSNIPYSCL